MDSQAVVARKTGPIVHSPDGGAVPPGRQMPFRSAAARSRPSRSPIGATSDRAARDAALARRPSQVPVGRAIAAAAVQRDQRGASAQPSVRAPVAGAAGMLAVVGRSPGQPLNPQTRSDMENRLGGDFSGVRVHTSEAAAQLALAIGARAYTLGEEIGFGPGAYAPATAEGRRVLAHELVHVQQQRRGPVAGSPRGGVAVSDPGDDFERHARAVADRVITDSEEPAGDALGVASPVTGVTRGIVLQRQEAPAGPGLAVDSSSQVRRGLERARAEAVAAAKQSELLRGKLDDAMRAAYRTGKESRIREVAEEIGTALDIGMGLHELARRISESLTELHGIELAPVSELTEALSDFNKGLAAFNLMLTLTDTERKSTAAEEGMRQINSAAGAFAALSTLAGLPAHIGLYANLYLVPLTKAIMAQLSRVVESLHARNVESEEALGGPLLYPGAEPGGQEMFEFMVAVMHAARADQLPPMPDAVKEYLLEHREQIEAGTRLSPEVEGEEIPTTGGWFWRELDTPRALEWLLAHRQLVWAMFYGSMQPPRNMAIPRTRNRPVIQQLTE